MNKAKPTQLKIFNNSPAQDVSNKIYVSLKNKITQKIASHQESKLASKSHFKRPNLDFKAKLCATQKDHYIQAKS